MKIIAHQGPPPDVQQASDKRCEAILAIFRQQNEIIRQMATTIVVVPEGTRLREKDTEDGSSSEPKE